MSASGAGSLRSRQTRRNTQMVTSDEGTHVMDPWKDDRLRDFIAINVQTRLLSFHLPPGAPLADAGAHNRQRVDQLLLLPRTPAMCDGSSHDCVLRRVFCRIYGPTALHHERHEQQHAAASSIPIPAPSPSATAATGPPHAVDTATPLRHVPSDIGGESPDPLTLAADQTGPPLESNVVRNLMDAVEGTSPVAGEAEHLTAGAQRAATPSLTTTAGSATPLDYHADLDCRCCSACVDAMCAHFQSMLLRGIIFDRFSQKDLLFAHWVLFRHMEGPPLDGHTSVGRREALSIQIKSGYYDLLKVPRAEETTATAVVVASPTLPASEHLPSSAGGLATELRGATSRSTGVPRKRGRGGNAVDEPDPSKPVDGDDDNAASSARQHLRDTFIRDVESKTYATRRSAASSSARAETSAAAAAATKNAGVEKRPRGRAAAVEAPTAAEQMPPPPAAPRPSNRASKRKSSADAAPSNSLLPQVKHEAAASSVMSTPTSTTSPVAFDIAAAAAAGSDVVPSSRSMKAATKQAAARMKDEEVALRGLLGLSKTDDAAASLRAEMYPTTSQSTKQTLQAPKRTAASSTAVDDGAITRCAATAMAADPLRRYTFGQQCLLLLAASRYMAPTVSVGASCPSVSSDRRPTPMDYWAAEDAAGIKNVAADPH